MKPHGVVRRRSTYQIALDPTHRIPKEDTPMHLSHRIVSVTAAATLLVLAGCGEKVKPVSPTDNPQHHTVSGMELLEQNRIDDAISKFNRAIQLDDEFSRAYGGLSIAMAVKATANPDAGYSQVDVDKAVDAHKKSGKYADATPEDELIGHINAIRYFTTLRSQDWFEDAADAFEDAKKIDRIDERKMPYYQGAEALDYYMGWAYLKHMDFQKARDAFQSVQDARRDGKWHPLALAAWKKTDRIVRAMSGITVGDVGKQIAMQDTVTRGDMAALFVDELKIDKLFAGRIPVRSQTPGQADFTPPDITDSPFKIEVETLMKWHVRGLEPMFDKRVNAYLFYPSAPIHRKELALVLEDVLIKLTGDQSIPTRFLGQQQSPFPDVVPSAPWFNAVQTVASRNLMETELSGEFRPDDEVDGAEALLAIKVLKQTMNIY